MVPRPFEEKALPRSGGEKSLDSQFEIVAEAFLESFELLEEYAPVWYTEQHRKRALNARRILQANPLYALGSERRRASQPLQVRHSAERELSANGCPRPTVAA
jgi:hypothetical protein